MSAHKEIRALTGLRGIAALYVVLFHYTDGLHPTNAFKVLISHGYLAVDIFFVLSGFVMALNYRHLFSSTSGTPLWRAYTVFLGRRIARIYPLYLCGTIAGYVVLRFTLPDTASFSELHQTLGLNLAMVQAWFLAPNLDGPSWSLSTEWAAYLIFPALLSLVFFRRTLRHLLGVIACIVAITVFAWLPQVLHHATFSFSNDFFDLNANQVLRCLPEFALGILIVRGLGTSWERFFVSRAWTGTLLSVVLIALLMFRGTDWIFVLLLPLLVLSLMRARSLSARLLSSGPVHYLGLISYSLYIVHSLFTGVLVRIHTWAQFHELRHAQSYAAAFGFSVALPLAALTYRYIELPGSRLLRHWFEGSPATKPKPAPLAETPYPAPGISDAARIHPPAIAFTRNSR